MPFSEDRRQVNERNRDVTPTDVVSCAAVDELDYKPRNTKEKWLLRIAYWGTIALVAFCWVGIRETEIAMSAIAMLRQLSAAAGLLPS